MTTLFLFLINKQWIMIHWLSLHNQEIKNLSTPKASTMHLPISEGNNIHDHHSFKLGASDLICHHQLSDPKQLNYHYHEPEQQIKTARIHPSVSSQAHHNSGQESLTVDDNSSEGIYQELRQLQEENRLKKQAIAQATSIIDTLSQKNKILLGNIESLMEQYELMKEQYKAQLEKANTIIKQLYEKSLSSTTYPNRVTQVKMYSHQSPRKSRVSPQHSNTEPLKQLQHILLKQQMYRLQSEFREITDTIQAQKSYLVDFAMSSEQAISTVHSQLIDKDFEYLDSCELESKQIGRQRIDGGSGIEVMNLYYKQLVRNWEYYSNSLRVCLFQCLESIRNLAKEQQPDSLLSLSQIQAKQPCYNSQPQYIQPTLLKIIKNDINKIINSFYAKLTQENRELKELMSQLIQKIKGA